MLKERLGIDLSLNYGRKPIEGFLRGIAPFERVLDIGAGRGDDLAIARAVCPGARLFGLDSYPVNIRLLEKQGIEVHSGNLERDVLPWPGASLDVIIGNQILEHTKEIFWILHEISRTLKVGGHLIIGVPNLAALHNRILLAAGRQPSPLKNNSAHLRGFTKRDMIALLNSAFPEGYHLDGFAGGNFYPFPPWLARPLAALFPTLAYGIFFRFKKTRSYEREFLEFPVKERLETNFYLGTG
jgi:SAM-dependent methyltransferase